MKLKYLFVVGLFCGPVGLFPGAAAGDETDLTAFNNAVAAAHVHYRSAYWYTRTRNGAIAGLDLMDLRARWEAIDARYGAAPPAPYQPGSSWNDALSRASRAIAEAAALVEAGDDRSANKAIVGFGDALADLRRAQGFYSFSDRVRAYRAVVDEISPLRAWKRPLSEADLQNLRDASAVLLYLLRDMAQAGPAVHGSDPGFAPTLADNKRAVDKLRQFMDMGNERAVKGSIRDVRAALGLLFLKYG